MMTVQIAQADVPNLAGRIYTREALQAMIDEQEKKNPNRILGTIGMPDSEDLDISRISHSVSNLRLDEEGRLLGDVLILETKAGEIMKRILEAEPSRQFRMAGIGKLKDNDDGTTSVVDFRLT